MDPLAAQAGSANSVRPALALDASLSAVLREGRVVAGEVLQTMDGGSLLVGIGRHRVPADANVGLQAGDRFLAQVEKSENGTTLRVIGGRGEGESQLLGALRAAIGQDRPIGELLGDLAARLRASLNSGEPTEKSLGELLRKVSGHVFKPGSSGADLARLMARSGLDYEALLLAQSQAGGTPVSGVANHLSSFILELVFLLQARFAQVGANLLESEWKALEKGLAVESDLPGLLEGVIGRGELLARLGSEFEERFIRLLRQAMGREPSQAQLDGLREVLAHALRGAAGEKLAEHLQKLLGPRQTAAALSGNLKGELLAALVELPAGEARDAVARALAGMEAEQLLNLARRESQEGWHMSLPVPDGEGWATAHLFYRHPEHSADQADSAGEDMQRMTVAVDFSSLGPLKAEIGVRGDLVAMRIMVTSLEVVEALRGKVSSLVDCFGGADRDVRVSFALAAPEETEQDPLTTDIRWLEEHRLMDLSG